MNTCCTTVPVHAITPDQRDAMWHLFDQYYSGITREVFEHDLNNKHQALLLWNDKNLIGFTSQRFCEVASYRVLYSGDIIIVPSARDIGTAHFFKSWAHTVWQRCDWWCALASGPRTFRLPYAFFHRVTPHPDYPETAREANLRRAFARHEYGDDYHHESGIVKLKHPYREHGTQAQIRPNYPMSGFFQEVNPDWRQGDEMVSIISLHPENWNTAAMRMLQWKGQHA